MCRKRKVGLIYKYRWNMTVWESIKYKIVIDEQQVLSVRSEKETEFLWNNKL
jgi:hypothetical protein